MLWSRSVLIVCVFVTALTALSDLGQSARQAIVGGSLAAGKPHVQARLPQLGSQQSAMAASAARVAKVSAGFSKIADLEPAGIARSRYDYLGGRTRPPASSIEPEQVENALIDLRESLQPAVEENSARDFPKRNFGKDLLREELESGLYARLRKDEGIPRENLAIGTLSTMLADLVETLGTRAFDEVNLARLTNSLPGRPSLNEELLLSAVRIARGEFAEARGGLERVASAQSTNKQRASLVDRYRAVANYFDPELPGANGPIALPSQELLDVLVPLDGRTSEYVFGTRTRAEEVQEAFDAAYGKALETLTASGPMAGSENIRNVFGAIQSSVRRRDLEGALKSIEELKLFYENSERSRGLRAEWRLRAALERVEDASRVLVTRFVEEDEPFFVTVRENFFGQQGRSYAELPIPVAQFAQAIQDRLGFIRSNARESSQRTVYRALNRFFNAILDGEEPEVTDKLGKEFIKSVNVAQDQLAGRSQGSSNAKGDKSLLIDARRFARLFREGKMAVGSMKPQFLAPRASDDINALADGLNMDVVGRASQRVTFEPAKDAKPRRFRASNPRVRAVVADFRGDAETLFSSATRRSPELGAGYTESDFLRVVTELIVIAERGEDTDNAYERLLLPILANPFDDPPAATGPFSSRTKGESLRGALKNLADSARKAKKSRAAKRQRGVR